MTPPTRFLVALAFGAVLASWHGPAARAADKQTFLGQHGDWYTYRILEDGNRTCYMVSKPTRSRGKFKKRGDVVAFVTHRPKEGERDVVNFQAGFTYKDKSTVVVTIKDRKFSLFTSKDTAWARNAADDKAMVAAMIKGTVMEVRGTPVRGRDVVDVYSLRGFTGAYKTIGRACGLK